MIMKKLIAIAVVFALAAGGLFAADLGVTVQGSVTLFEGNTTGSKATGEGQYYNPLVIEGSGENDDGTFGAWARFVPSGSWWGSAAGLAWWKPIDQFKLAIGGNPDGLYPKEGYSAWMFHQKANDSGVVSDDQAWGSDYAVGGEQMRDAFYGGYGSILGLYLEIKPVDMFALNVILPYNGSKVVADIFRNMTIQVDVNLDFGNIALTYGMKSWGPSNDKIGGKMFLFFDLTAIENLNLALGVGIPLPENTSTSVFGYTVSTKHMDNIGIGLAAKYAINDAFNIKARALVDFLGSTKVSAGGITGTSKEDFKMIFDVQPCYALNDNIRILADIGINMVKPDGADAVIGFHFNPYVWIGQEWGPGFYAGVKVYKAADGEIYYAVPIGLNISF
jgi:hypothetical protein